MITTRACDCCQQPLTTEVAQFERVEGSVVFLAHQRWSIEPRAAGLRMGLICRPCGDFLSGAIEHLRAARHSDYVADGAKYDSPAAARAAS
ncbi:MAG: hypothetical protein Q8M79_09905 [Dehalococcoidia bacterium]|nr:hypothetical protein [Dehalococcoidia bacterium]